MRRHLCSAASSLKTSQRRPYFLPAELPSFSPERFAERDKHPEFLGGCVFSKNHPRLLKFNTLRRFPPDDYIASPTETVKMRATRKRAELFC